MPNRTEAARRKPSQSPLGDYGHCAFSRLHRRSLIVLASRFRASRLTRRDASAIAPQGGGDWRARSSRCGSSGGNHWNQECRGVLGVVQDRVCGRHKLAARRLIRAGVQVAIKAREIAAGNFQAYDVAPPKDIACSPQIQCDRSSDFHILGKWLRGIDKHVVTILNGALVTGSRFVVRSVAAE